MPVQTDAPIATGAVGDWGLYGSAPNKPAAVAVNDGDSSVIYASSGGRVVWEQMQFPTLAGLTDPVTAASITAITRCYLIGGGGRTFCAVWNGIEVGLNRQQEVRLAMPNYVTVTYPAAGAAELALSAVNGEHGFMFSAAGGPSNKAEYWITQLYRTVDFDYLAGNAGEFAYQMASLAGLFIGANLLFREMPALARFLWRRAGYLIKPEEYEVAFRAWKERLA